VCNDKYNITGDEPNDQNVYNILIDKNTDKYRYIIMSSAYEDYFGKKYLVQNISNTKEAICDGLWSPLYLALYVNLNFIS
jgi:hypothetical protein